MDFNGRIHVVRVLVIDKSVEGAKKVRRESCRCADGSPMDRVAAPPKRDAWASKVPEGACKLTGFSARPPVYALVVCPKSSCMQGGYPHVRRLDHGPWARSRNARPSAKASYTGSGQPQCTSHKRPLEENGGSSICHGRMIHANHRVWMPDRLHEDCDAPTMPKGLLCLFQVLAGPSLRGRIWQGLARSDGHRYVA